MKTTRVFIDSRGSTLNPIVTQAEITQNPFRNNFVGRTNFTVELPRVFKNVLQVQLKGWCVPHTNPVIMGLRPVSQDMNGDPLDIAIRGFAFVDPDINLLTDITADAYAPPYEVDRKQTARAIITEQLVDATDSTVIDGWIAFPLNGTFGENSTRPWVYQTTAWSDTDRRWARFREEVEPHTQIISVPELEGGQGLGDLDLAPPAWRIDHYYNFGDYVSGHSLFLAPNRFFRCELAHRSESYAADIAKWTEVSRAVAFRQISNVLLSVLGRGEPQHAVTFHKPDASSFLPLVTYERSQRKNLSHLTFCFYNQHGYQHIPSLTTDIDDEFIIEPHTFELEIVEEDPTIFERSVYARRP